MNLYGVDISITNSSAFMILVVVLVCFLGFVGTRSNGLVPSKAQIVAESIFYFIGNLTKSNLEKEGILLFPYVFSLFIFILFGNLIGLFPFAFSFTSQPLITISMALAVFIFSIGIGITKKGKSYARHFCPAGLPVYLTPFFIVIELISFLFRPISLGVRLFANMVSGHIMIKVIASFAVSIAGFSAFSCLAVVPVILNIFLNIFKVVVCILQAYVFVVLSCIYISESVSMHEENS